MNLTFTRLKTQEIDFDFFPLGITIIRNEHGSGIIFGLMFFVFYLGMGDALTSVSFSYNEDYLEDNNEENAEYASEERIIDERGSD